MRNLLLFAAHFPPSNLAGVHRARLWAQHLREFGWRPIIVTTDWSYYEERLDWELCNLLDHDLEVVRTKALPTKPLRIVGDIGIRGLPWHLSAIRKLYRERKIDFLHITVPSFYSTLIGQLLYVRKPIPFGIDYIDPWVHSWPEAERLLSKAWASLQLARVLEPWAVRNASLITGVAEGYFRGVLERNPRLKEQAVTAAMPYGASELDYEVVARSARQPVLFDPADGAFHMVYAGAMLPKAYAVLDRLLEALLLMRERHPAELARLRIHFIGTGKAPDDPNGHNILPRVTQMGLAAYVSEHPQRVPYVEVLTHLVHASAVLILGSTEPHYTPSKVYQSVQARRPVLALLHESSTAINVLEHSGAGIAIKLTEERLPTAQELAASLASFMARPYDAAKINWTAFEAFSARQSARLLAEALDQAVDRFHHRLLR